MILGDGTEVRTGNTYGQGEVGDKRGSKEMDQCPLTLMILGYHNQLYTAFIIRDCGLTYKVLQRAAAERDDDWREE
jgi:hypothetical protein